MNRIYKIRANIDALSVTKDPNRAKELVNQLLLALNSYNLNGFFKETYADKLAELIPDGVKLLKYTKLTSINKKD